MTNKEEYNNDYEIRHPRKRAGQKEMLHWREMLAKRRQPVTMWHYLKVDID